VTNQPGGPHPLGPGDGDPADYCGCCGGLVDEPPKHHPGHCCSQLHAHSYTIKVYDETGRLSGLTLVRAVGGPEDAVARAADDPRQAWDFYDGGRLRGVPPLEPGQ